MKKEFKGTHYWKQYPNIEFEVNADNKKIRAKGKNDHKSTNWVNIYTDKNNVRYFTIKHEKIYWFNITEY